MHQVANNFKFCKVGHFNMDVYRDLFCSGVGTAWTYLLFFFKLPGLFQPGSRDVGA